MITIIDYKAGNLTSVKRGLDHLGLVNQISADPDVIRSAGRLIFPGVGQASAAMRRKPRSVPCKVCSRSGIQLA